VKTLHITDPPMTGTNVRRVQRALVQAGYRIRVDGIFGPGTLAAVMDAKRRLGYRKRGLQIRPTAGDTFMGLLEKARMPLVPQRPKTERVRDAIVAYCRWGIAHEPQIHYAQVRPFPVSAPRLLPMRTDCSGFATLAYREAGAPDPNGRKYDGLGFTGTLLQHGRRVAPEHARRGDLAIFGPGTGHHVVVLLEDGRRNLDPLTCSHGQERGPLEIRLAEEARFQPSPIVIVNYLGD
jgi:hypothetical protein